MNIEWNADKYAKDFSFVHEYGEGVISLIDFSMASAAIDLGCGNGKLTALLKERGLSVIGIDSSPEQLEIAEKLHPDIPFVNADAISFTAAEPVDVVFSNAVFHWIDREKQPQMISSIAKALKKGGQLVFEMGGFGNNRLIHSALEKVFEKHGYKYRIPFFFPTIGEYSALLEDGGLLVTYAILFDRFTELKGDDGLRDWIEMFIRTPFDAVKDEDEEKDIIDEAVDDLRDQLFRNGRWHSDYVRLRMKAMKM